MSNVGPAELGFVAAGLAATAATIWGLVHSARRHEWVWFALLLVTGVVGLVPYAVTRGGPVGGADVTRHPSVVLSTVALVLGAILLVAIGLTQASADAFAAAFPGRDGLLLLSSTVLVASAALLAGVAAAYRSGVLHRWAWGVSMTLGSLAAMWAGLFLLMSLMTLR